MNKIVQDVSAQAVSSAVYSFVYGVDTVTLLLLAAYTLYFIQGGHVCS